MKVYLSSTFLDLEDHREKVAKALRKAIYDVVMMEEYVTRDELVEIACKGDVTGCDAYLGLFAWRYGHIPEDNNPERQSVTELELYTGGTPIHSPSGLSGQRQCGLACTMATLRDSNRVLRSPQPGEEAMRGIF